MGVELKRVALDFEWPLSQPWSGYCNSHYAKCATCDGSGSTLARKRLSDLVSLLMLSGDDAKRGKCHPYFDKAPLHNTQGAVCGSDMTALTVGLAGRKPSFMGHDSCDKWSATKKIIAAAGLPESWGVCADCEGDGISNDKREAYEAWEKSEPPAGEGYQIWETVSEGSPISPVFATPEELAQYMATHGWGGDTGGNYATWLRFINGPGWAPSMVMDEHGIRTGADAA